MQRTIEENAERDSAHSSDVEGDLKETNEDDKLKKDEDSGLDSRSDSERSCDEDGFFVCPHLRRDSQRVANSLHCDTSQVPFPPARRNKHPPEQIGIPSCPFADKPFQLEIENLQNFRSEGERVEKCGSAILDIVELNNNNANNNDPDICEFFKALEKGQYETVDFKTSLDDRPEWLDEEKFRRGQKFATAHLICLNFAEMLSLLMLFALKPALGPLIFTEKSDTPYRSFQRYLSTVTRLISWYSGDVWGNETNSARTNLSIVRGMHKNVYTKLTTATEKELREKTVLDERKTPLWSSVKEVVQDDFRGSCPMAMPGLNPYLSTGRVWVNQLDMSVTQFGFVGLAVTYPKEFGIHNATDEDLDSFLHMWRGLGFLLGVKDEYNFCNADLPTVRKRTRDLIDFAIKPAFRDVDASWEHMSRCLVEGISYYVPSANFESSLMYLCNVLNIHTPRLRKSITWYQSFLFYLTKLVLGHMMKVPAILKFLNNGIFRVIRRAQEASPELLSKWENRKYSYMKNEPQCTSL